MRANTRRNNVRRYSGSDFDREFIYQLSEFVVRLSEAKVKKAAAAFSERPLKRLEASCFTAESILADINGSGAFTVELQEKDIVQIISSLVWESKLTVIVTGRQKVSDDGSTDEPKKYKAHSSRIEIVGACEEGPDVTPAETCNCSGCVQRFVLAHLLDDGIWYKKKIFGVEAGGEAGRGSVKWKWHIVS